jgi:predicted RNA-binding Zn ribbon-like protein
VDYPKLDLPLALELANTIFVSAGQPCDALASPADLDAWLRANVEQFSSLPPTATMADVNRFRSLRHALRRIFSSVADATAPLSEDIEVLNTASAAAPEFARFDWFGRGPRMTLLTTADATTTALARIARTAIELLAGPNMTRISDCQAPGCVLFFLREPRRRHWCSPACGNRARVARHYARHRPAQGAARSSPKDASDARSSNRGKGPGVDRGPRVRRTPL